MKWLIRRYMVERHIENLKELSKDSGIKYRTLLDRLEHPQDFRVYEIVALDNVLKFENDDLLEVMRSAS